MKHRITIGTRIGGGFGLLIILIIVINSSTLSTLDKSREINEEMIDVHAPSVDELQELKILITKSRLYINDWVKYEKELPFKQTHSTLINEIWPNQRQQLEKIAEHWSDDERRILQEIDLEIESLFSLHEEIMLSLSTFDSYQDPFAQFTASTYTEEGGDIDNQTKAVLARLDDLISWQRANTEKGADEMYDSFNALEFVVRYLGFALALGGILIAFLTVRTIVKPVQKLKYRLSMLGKGIVPQEKMRATNDEIGDMTNALNDLVDGFNRTVEFAAEVGSGNFESEYKPLSDEDKLGHSLLHMRKDLSELTSNLEQKVEERTQKIEDQKKEIEILLKHTTDSIVYAKRIQEAILPPKSYVDKVLPNSFFLYRPKDIVSGDFYWVHEKNDKVVFAAMDCTGHGVPGAFMTIIGHNGLNRAINIVESDNPAKILDALNKEVSSTFNQGEGSSIKDGMDAAMCTIDYKTKELQFSGAYNPLYLIRDGEVLETKGDKFPVGEFLGDEKQNFTNHTVQLQEGDTIYVFSDGYADQFGGPKGKKFMYKRFRQLLLDIQKKPMLKQQEILNEEIDRWRGDLEQVDDIIVIGLRV